MNHCKYCGKEAENKFCNKDCYYAYLKDPTKNPMYGKKHSEKTKKKQSSSKAKIYTKFCVVCGKGLQARQKYYCCQECRSKGMAGSNNHFFGKHHKTTSIASNKVKHTGKSPSRETRRKMRRSAIEYRKSLNPGWHPSYNKKACDFFRKFDSVNNTSGQHAENGGEYLIDELGYYLDYINFDKKLIIEFDERRHYAGGELKEADKIREEEIKACFPDFEFKRIHEKEAN